MMNLNTILDPKSLPLPPKPKVEAIEFQEIIDSIGDPAIEIVLVLAENSTDEERHWRNIKPISDAISEALRKAGEHRFPYLRSLKRSELRELAAGRTV